MDPQRMMVDPKCLIAVNSICGHYTIIWKVDSQTCDYSNYFISVIFISIINIVNTVTGVNTSAITIITTVTTIATSTTVTNVTTVSNVTTVTIVGLPKECVLYFDPRIHRKNQQIN